MGLAKGGEVLVARFGCRLKSGHSKLNDALHRGGGGGGSPASWCVALECHQALPATP